MMHYLRVAWRHDFVEEPVELLSELDADSWEVRKVERFRDGSWGWADADASGGPTRLGIETVPPLVEINADCEFRGCAIDRAEFEAVWKIAQAARPAEAARATPSGLMP